MENSLIPLLASPAEVIDLGYDKMWNNLSQWIQCSDIPFRVTSSSSSVLSGFHECWIIQSRLINFSDIFFLFTVFHWQATIMGPVSNLTQASGRPPSFLLNFLAGGPRNKFSVKALISRTHFTHFNGRAFPSGWAGKAKSIPFIVCFPSSREKSKASHLRKWFRWLIFFVALLPCRG